MNFTSALSGNCLFTDFEHGIDAFDDFGAVGRISPPPLPIE